MFPYKCPACGRSGFTDRKKCPGCRITLRNGEISDSERNRRDSCAALVGWTTLGAILGMLYFCFGLWVAAGGHGWLIPGIAGLFSIITAPGAGLAWGLRRTPTGWWIALGLLFFEMLVNVWLVIINFKDSKGSGEPFENVWEAAAVWVGVWAILYLAHQLVAQVIVFFYKHRA
jgi:hypothetical protein